MMKESLTKNGLMLGAFAVVTTALIALTFYGTSDKIEQQKQQKLLSVLNEVVPSEFHDNALYANCTQVNAVELGGKKSHKVYRATLNGSPSALVLEATAPNGYSGDIDIVVGVNVKATVFSPAKNSDDVTAIDNTSSVNADMTVLGVRVIEHKETPGLGDKIELAVSNWITSFNGKSFSKDNLAPWQVKKDGGEFDQFTGATITPRAVVGAVREALLYAHTNKSALFSAPNTCESKDNVNTTEPTDINKAHPQRVEEL